MQDFADTINAVNNPDQAIDQFLGEQFIEWLIQYIGHEMQSQPVFAILSDSTAPPQKIKKFMLQRFQAQMAFLGRRDGDPGFLRFAIANLSESDDPSAEPALEILEKRRQEELEGHRIERGIMVTKNRELWVRLLKVLGSTDEEISRSEPKEVVRNYIAELSEVFSNSEWQTALGAYAAMQQSDILELEKIALFLKKIANLKDGDLQALNEINPDRHILDKIVFDSETKRLVWEGVLIELNIHRDFLAGIAKYLN